MQNLYKATGNEAIKPNSYCYATVLNVWARSRAPEAPVRAQALFDEMLDNYKAGDMSLRPSSAAYAALMTVWSRSSRPDAPLKALAVLNEMQERHLDDPVTSEEPNSLHFSAVISAFAEQGDVENARALLQRIIDSDAQPHEGCFFE